MIRNVMPDEPGGPSSPIDPGTAAGSRDERTPADPADGGAPDPDSGGAGGPAPHPGPDVPCRHHDDRRAASLCDRCGDFLCGLCTIRLDGLSYCPTCVVKVRADVMRVGAYVPWEDRQRLGVFRAAWETIRVSFTRPQEFMERLPLEGGITDPLLFGMLMRSMVVVLYGVLAAGVYLIIAAATQDPFMLFQAGMQLFSIFLNILQWTAFLFVIAGIIHLGVMVFGGARGYEATFRVYAYGRTTDVLELIPIAGFFAAVGMRIYLYHLGLQPAHGISARKALVAASLPILLWFFFTLFVVGIVIVIVLLLL